MNNAVMNSLYYRQFDRQPEDAGNAGPTLSIDANATGIFNDNTHTYTAAATDAMNYQSLADEAWASGSVDNNCPVFSIRVGCDPFDYGCLYRCLFGSLLSSFSS